jgi:polysaccharide biosynthesis transport protein
MNENHNLPAIGPPAGGTEHAGGYSRYAGFPEDDHTDVAALVKRAQRAVSRYKWLVLAVVLAGGTGAWLFARSIPPEYTAEATIWIEVANRSDGMRGPIQASELLRNEAWIELLRSFRVLEPVVRREQLYLDHHVRDADIMGGFQVDPDSYTPGQYSLVVNPGAGRVELRNAEGEVLERAGTGDAIGRTQGFVWRPTAEMLAERRTVSFSLLSPREASRQLNSQLTTRMASGGNFMRLSYTGEDAARVVSVTNAVAEQYVEVAADMKQARLRELHAILQRQLEHAESNLRQAEHALESFRVHTITLPSETATPVAPGLESTRAPVLGSFFGMKIERDALERDRNAIRGFLSARGGGLSVDGLNVIPAVQQSPELRQALMDLASKRAEQRALSLQFTPEHPQVQRANADIETLERQVVPQLAAGVASDLEQRMAALDGMVGSAAAELRAIPARAIDEARYRRAVATAENLYVDLRQRYEGARLANETFIPDITVHDPAMQPRRAATDRARRVLLLGFGGSLFLGLAGAVLLDRVDRRLRYAEQVTDELGLTIIGAVPTAPQPKRLPRANGAGGAGRAGRAEHSAIVSSHELVEALRAVRMNLMTAFGSAGPIMVTISSPGTGDGKSFMTANLGLAFADLNLRTLIVDGDTRRGCLHRLFGVERQPGLTDYLAETITEQELVRQTRYPLVDIITGGSRMPNSPELLSSSRMGALLPGMRSRYDVVLVDSPPLGAGIDPLILGTISGNMLLVMRAGTTERALAEAKLRMLDRLPIRLLGTVLNGYDFGEAYYYYSYMPGYESGEEGPERPRDELQPA